MGAQRSPWTRTRGSSALRADSRLQTRVDVAAGRTTASLGASVKPGKSPTARPGRALRAHRAHVGEPLAQREDRVGGPLLLTPTHEFETFLEGPACWLRISWATHHARGGVAFAGTAARRLHLGTDLPVGRLAVGVAPGASELPLAPEHAATREFHRRWA